MVCDARSGSSTHHGLGLLAALALLAACGPGRPGADGDDGSEGSEPDLASEAMCTEANFADDPDRLSHTARGCRPLARDGSCAPCDEACAELILPECRPADCESFDLPAGCPTQCSDYRVLCSEVIGGECCHLVTGQQGVALPGRPLRLAGVAQLPALELEDPPAGWGRIDAAARYREFARYEQASVPAFRQARAVLAGLGAPVELLDDYDRAAQQEGRHADLALAAAEALDGRRAHLGELPPAPAQVELASFVRELVRDGCLGEAVAAREAAWALTHSPVHEREALARYWRAVAKEELDHARLAWRTLEWLLARSPELTACVTAELHAALRAKMTATHTVELDASVGPGLPGAATRSALRRATLTQLVAEADVLAQALPSPT